LAAGSKEAGVFGFFAAIQPSFTCPAGLSTAGIRLDIPSAVLSAQWPQAVTQGQWLPVPPAGRLPQAGRHQAQPQALQALLRQGEGLPPQELPPRPCQASART
jgi:hypothetical protein